MPEDPADPQARSAKELFNLTWDLLDRDDRTPADDLQMLGSALASRELWRRIGAPRNHAISDWQVARVFAVLGDGAWSGRFAESGLALCRDHDLGPFLTAYAWESVARAARARGDDVRGREAVAAARRAADEIEDADDRQLVLDDLTDLTD